MKKKAIKFPLNMGNGVRVRTIEELRENFSMEWVYLYYTDGRLSTWLRDRNMDGQAVAVEKLDQEDPNILDNLCFILGHPTVGKSVDEAVMTIGKWFYEGEELEKNFEKAAECFWKLAGRGNAEAQYRLGECYRKGEGLPQSNENAIEWYQKAAEQGHAEARERLEQNSEREKEIKEDLKKAEMPEPESKEAKSTKKTEIEQEVDVKKQSEEAKRNFDLGKQYAANCMWPQAVEYYHMAAEQGNMNAQYALGRCYYLGTGVGKNYGKMVAWYGMAARQGHFEAESCLRQLARNERTGGYASDCLQRLEEEEEAEWRRKQEDNSKYCSDEEKRNFDLGEQYAANCMWPQAVECYQKAAEQGNMDAQYALGRCYYLGTGVAQNYEKTVAWYSMAARQGHFKAKSCLWELAEKEKSQYYIGFGYASDCLQRLEQEEAEKIELCQNEATQGSAEAQFRLGDYYQSGKGVKEDKAEAVKWFEKAAKQGYVEAQRRLGDCYRLGDGIEVDFMEAEEWYQKAIKHGNEEARRNLAALYCEWGVQCELEEKKHAGKSIKPVLKSVEFFQKAAELGDMEGQYLLGKHYQFVNGNYEVAVVWYEKAAERGHSEAQCNLGYCYRFGKGVRMDLRKAFKWYEKAAEQGHSGAQRVLQDISPLFVL